MKIVMAPDSFKESMTAEQAAQAMKRGVHAVLPHAECILRPMADGGEGFARAIASIWHSSWIDVGTVDALGRHMTAGYGLRQTEAVIDLASSCGLEHIHPHERNVMKSSTRGLGLMMGDAIDRGATHLIIGLGGSATNDAGMGMLVGLGARLVGMGGGELDPIPENLPYIQWIDVSALLQRLAGVRITVASDVINPLTGPQGATAVFGPQKGVKAEEVEALDAQIAAFARRSGQWAHAVHPGTGAAGGVGFSLLAFCGAQIRPGIDVVADAVHLPQAIAGADYVLTGEGSVDAQTLHGKTPAGVASIARKFAVPVWVFAGQVKPGAEVLYDHGVKKIVNITPRDQPLAVALKSGQANLENAVITALRDSLTLPDSTAS